MINASTRKSRSSASARPSTKTTVTGVEMFRKLLDQGRAGDNVGLLVRGIKREGRRAWSGCREARHHHPHTEFEGSVYIPSRTRAAVTRRSSTTTVRSSTSAPRT